MGALDGLGLCSGDASTGECKLEFSWFKALFIMIGVWNTPFRIDGKHHVSDCCALKSAGIQSKPSGRLYREVSFNSFSNHEVWKPASLPRDKPLGLLALGGRSVSTCFQPSNDIVSSQNPPEKAQMVCMYENGLCVIYIALLGRVSKVLFGLVPGAGNLAKMTCIHKPRT